MSSLFGTKIVRERFKKLKIGHVTYFKKRKHEVSSFFCSKVIDAEVPKFKSRSRDSGHAHLGVSHHSSSFV